MQSTPVQTLSSIDPRLPSTCKDISYDENKLNDIIKKETYTVSKDSITQLKSKCSNQKEFESEFYGLKEMTDEDGKHEANLYNESKNKNRYSDIRTYSYNKVELASKEYINGSFVHFPSFKRFIATQGPIDSTVEDFWQMIYDYNVKLIIMLCGVTENGRPKCSEYWGDTKPNSFNVKVVEEKSVNPFLKTRTFSLSSLKKKNDIRTVTQLHFLGWPDHGAPDINKVYDTFIDMIIKVEQVSKKDNSPIVTHCSAGVGRTGTFIAMYTLHSEIQNKKSFSIYNLVRKMKELRLFLVENILQYQFIYYFVMKLLSTILK